MNIDYLEKQGRRVKNFDFKRYNFTCVWLFGRTVMKQRSKNLAWLEISKKIAGEVKTNRNGE